MTNIRIDPGRGPHAAANLTDEALDYLVGIVAWEVAVRTSTDHFRDQLARLAEARPHMQSAIEQVRHERDLMHFAQEVLRDLEQPPDSRKGRTRRRIRAIPLTPRASRQPRVEETSSATRLEDHGACFNWPMAKNVLGDELYDCSVDPMTGWFRDGSCKTGPEDLGMHAVCAVMTIEFLEFSKNAGNDLSTPQPGFHFPGLNPGDRWCLGAPRLGRSHGGRSRSTGGPRGHQRPGTRVGHSARPRSTPILTHPAVALDSHHTGSTRVTGPVGLSREAPQTFRRPTVSAWRLPRPVPVAGGCW